MAPLRRAAHTTPAPSGVLRSADSMTRLNTESTRARITYSAFTVTTWDTSRSATRRPMKSSTSTSDTTSTGTPRTRTVSGMHRLEDLLHLSQHEIGREEEQTLAGFTPRRSAQLEVMVHARAAGEVDAHRPGVTRTVHPGLGARGSKDDNAGCPNRLGHLRHATVVSHKQGRATEQAGKGIQVGLAGQI